MEQNDAIHIEPFIYKISGRTFIISAIPKDQDSYELRVQPYPSLTIYEDEVRIDKLRQENEIFSIFKTIQAIINLLKLLLEKRDNMKVEIIEYENHCDLIFSETIFKSEVEFSIKLQKKPENLSVLGITELFNIQAKKIYELENETKFQSETISSLEKDNLNLQNEIK